MAEKQQEQEQEQTAEAKKQHGSSTMSRSLITFPKRHGEHFKLQI